MQDYSLDSLNDAINLERGNKESLERLAAYLYKVEAGKSGVKINEKNGIFYIKDWSGQIAALAAGANFYGLIYGATKHLKGTELLAEKRRLYESITGLSFVAVAGAPASQPRKNQPAKLAANEKKEAQNKITFGGWHTPNGRAIIDYFALKTGADNTAFLERYGVNPIKKVEFSTGKKSPNFDAQNFAFSYKANDWIKKIQPSAPKELKTLVLNTGANNYIFGVENLPAKGENLFIFEGESDAICANFHGSNCGFNAIAIGGAGKPILEQTANEFKARFKRVFVLFDNDSTGEKNGKELAQKHGFIYVDTAFCMLQFFAPKSGLDAIGLQTVNACKDLCDIFNFGNAYKGTDGAKYVIQFLSLCTGLNNRIDALLNDRFSIPIFHAIATPFSQYLSEKVAPNSPYNPLLTIALAIAKNKRVCLQAAAGAGKSTALIDLILLHFFAPNSQINKLYLEYENAIKRVVIAVPTIPLAKQLYTDFSGKDEDGNIINSGAPFPNCGLIYGQTVDKDKARFYDVIISVYDSVLLAEITDNTILIVDEAHQLITEFGYRDKATKSVLAAIKDAKHTLCLSATPNYLFNQYFDFKLLSGVAEITNKKHINICEYTGKEYELIPAILSEFLEERGRGRATGAIMIKIDDSKYLRAGAKYAQTLGLTSEVFCGKNEIFRSENANYNSILKTAKLATKVDVIFTTCLIEAGVSIKDEISHVYICDTLGADKIIQQLARPRFDAATGANKLINATIFISDKAANEKEKDAFERTYNATEIFNYRLNKATPKAALFNAQVMQFKDKNLPNDAKHYIYQKEDNSYAVNELAIMYDINEIAISKDKNLLSQRLKHTDKTIQNVSFSQITIAENITFSDCLEAINAEIEAAKSAAIDMLFSTANNDEKSLKMLFLQLLSTEKDYIKRGKLLTTFELQNDKAAKKEAFKFYSSLSILSQKILENADANILGFIDTVATYFQVPNTPLFDALDKAKVADKAAKKEAISIAQTNQLKERNKTVRKAIKEGKDCSAYDKNQYLIDKAVFDAFKKPIENRKSGQTKKQFSLEDLVKITNSILLQKDTPRNFKPKTATGKESVRAYLDKYFEITPVKKSREKGEITRYILVRKDTKKDTEK